jgi:hypothetical protein
VWEPGEDALGVGMSVGENRSHTWAGQVSASTTSWRWVHKHADGKPRIVGSRRSLRPPGAGGRLCRAASPGASDDGYLDHTDHADAVSSLPRAGHVLGA